MLGVLYNICWRKSLLSEELDVQIEVMSRLEYYINNEQMCNSVKG